MNDNGNSIPPADPQGQRNGQQPSQIPASNTTPIPAQHAPGHQAAHAAPGNHVAPASPSIPIVPQKKSSSGKTFLFGFLGAALACVLAFFSFGLYTSMIGGSGSGSVLGGTTSTEIITADEDQTLPEVVAAKALPSVVSVNVYTTQQPNSGLGSLFGYGNNSSSAATLVQSALGSGVVLSEDGYIITNYHVIEGAAQLKVTIEGEEYDADIVGSDTSSDIAVIKAKNASGLTPMEIGSSSGLVTGEWVMTLGSPYGLEQSAATGIVSAVSRSQAVQSTSGVSLYVNLIQTDSAINQGNSGGAMVDSDGKLVGINTLITSTSGDFSGVGFAIPIDYAIGLARDIIDGKTPTHAQLGVSLSTVTSDVAARYNLPVKSGAYITAVSSGGAADKAGLQAGDIITKFNGQDVASSSDLMLDVRSLSPGDTVQVEYNRNGQTQTTDVTLGSDAS